MNDKLPKASVDANGYGILVPDDDICAGPGVTVTGTVTVTVRCEHHSESRFRAESRLSDSAPRTVGVGSLPVSLSHRDRDWHPGRDSS